MDFYALSDRGIAQKPGRRFSALRLCRTGTWKVPAGATSLSLNTIKVREKGSDKLSTEGNRGAG